MEPRELLRKRQSIWNKGPLLFWPALAVIGVWVLKILIGEGFHTLIPVIVTGLAAMVWFVAWIQSRMWTYVVFEDTVFAQRKLLSRDTFEVRIARLRSIDVKQSFYQRILGIGDVTFKSAGDFTDVEYEGVRNPEAVKRVVQKQQSEMEQAGMSSSAENQGATT